ncbi:MAG: glycosyltransferase family 2 protein [Pseudomonadota bacterium]
MTRLLVIILNYRTAQMTLRAAEAALADMPEGGELVLVDNASGDGSARVLQEEITARGWAVEGRVRLILSNANGGFGAGNNLGLKAAMSDGTRPDFFYVLNSDAFLDPGCIAALLAHLHAHPKAAFAASHVRGEDGVAHTTAFRFPSVQGEFEGAARIGVISRFLARAVVAPPLPQEAARVDWAAGASVLMRAEALRDIGLFDETFFLYFEETDLMKRAARKGWQTWYVPQARVVHIGSVSTGMKDWQRTPPFWFASRRHYFVKNYGRGYAAAAWAARLAGSALHALRCAVTGRPSQDPPHFVGDLFRFGLGLSRADHRPKPSRTPSEDRS